jgi:hypothetical protein
MKEAHAAQRQGFLQDIIMLSFPVTGSLNLV